ncbi:DMT family transporter [Devosia sp. ZB163]|uniref:DMT family transporter n=1 Tax=Devosia sp. ZB163 TaxID=3025938 RepID=UPI00235F733F|nr:DMT family transporter [Devosia sp. ZB163]MDC9825594.1 DMT family transporter [Devosia sp. ZB163]
MTKPTRGQTRRRADNVALGIGLTLFAIVIFGIQDAVSKSLVQTHSPFQLAMIRFWAFAAFSLVLVARQGPLKEAFRSKYPWLQWLRALLLVVDIWAFAIALKTVPLAELQAVVLVYPLMATLVAVPILGEKVGVFRMVAVFIGFCGALVIVRPGGLPIDGGVMFAMLSAASYAVYIALTRKVSSTDTTATSMVYVGVGGLILTTAVGVFFWEPMDLAAMLQMGLVMVTSTAAHGLMMVALSRAPASTLQPFNYFALPWGIFLSYQFFGHLIDPVALIGGGVIVGAGLVVMARERHLSRQGKKIAPTEAEEEYLPH